MSYDTEFIQIEAVVFRNGARMYATGINFGGIKSVVQSTLTEVSQLYCPALLYMITCPNVVRFCQIHAWIQ